MRWMVGKVMQMHALHKLTPSCLRKGVLVSLKAMVYVNASNVEVLLTLTAGVDEAPR